ncbi:MAG: hypothetical protein V3T23_00810, partial [Nitrososphaerales archaeon]
AVFLSLRFALCFLTTGTLIGGILDLVGRDCQFERAQVSLKLISVTAKELRPLFRTCKLLLIIN